VSVKDKWYRSLLGREGKLGGGHELSGNSGRLQQRIDELENEVGITDTMVKAGQSKLEKLEAENKRLRECVGFYADGDSWIDNNYYRTTIKETDWRSAGPISAIGGKRARACLWELEK
jgi:hypothetical protein